MPIQGDVRVWIIDECHKLTGDAQNALLKILEDTPEHVYFVLCTTDPQKLLPTIKGRCSQFQVLPLTDTQMKGLLRSVVHEEGETVESEVYDQIITSAKGHPRNALQILEQVLNVQAEDRMAAAKKAEAEIVESIVLCRALLKGAPWKEIAGILKGVKDQEAEGVRRVVLGYCQAILLSGKDEPMCGLIMENFMNPFYDSGFPQLTYACYSVTKNQ
jgi:DNA polymerase-3 subunit gamma/tau